MWKLVLCECVREMDAKCYFCWLKLDIFQVHTRIQNEACCIRCDTIRRIILHPESSDQLCFHLCWPLVHAPHLPHSILLIPFNQFLFHFALLSSTFRMEFSSLFVFDEFILNYIFFYICAIVVLAHHGRISTCVLYFRIEYIRWWREKAA